jgi:hypothetical protein
MIAAKSGTWALAVLGLGLGTGLLAQGRGREDQGKPGSPPENQQLIPHYSGVNLCARCHDHDHPVDDKAMAYLCQCTEVGVWKKSDKHSLAYKALTGDRGRQMGQLLGCDVSRESSCLACHAVNTAQIRPDQQEPGFQVEEGVTCVVCHGPYKAWVDAHGAIFDKERRLWRARSRAEKESAFGMTDLWDPAKRTKVCASCHIGSTEENKVLTHAMYAAGHPPLPAFEISAFSNQMHRHWEYIKEKRPEVQKLLGFVPGKQDFEETQLALAGSVSALGQYAGLLATQAEQAANGNQTTAAGLDWAVFDCYACHHDLKTRSWRQERGYIGKPGRPRMRPWPMALVKLAVGESAVPEAGRELDAGFQKLDGTFNIRPFGDLRAVQATAHALSDQLGRPASALGDPHQQFNRERAGRVLRRLCAAGAGEVLDYDAARQLAWVFRTIYEEYKLKDQPDPKLEELVGRLGSVLHLEPPAGQKQEIMPELAQRLKAVNDYDPDGYRDVFRLLCQRLEAGAR